MGTTDDGLDAVSRKLLSEIDELRDLEREKRLTARSTDEFHDLAEQVEVKALDVFHLAHVEQTSGADDSPIHAERAEQHPADWTEGSRR